MTATQPFYTIRMNRTINTCTCRWHATISYDHLGLHFRVQNSIYYKLCYSMPQVSIDKQHLPEIASDVIVPSSNLTHNPLARVHQQIWSYSQVHGILLLGPNSKVASFSPYLQKVCKNLLLSGSAQEGGGHLILFYKLHDFISKVIIFGPGLLLLLRFLPCLCCRFNKQAVYQ